ncbi:MAG: hypothetical protein FJ320_01840 [SAR202 cluster bacterium]|nr:hypothetical protein [SAR202 cluster bacterium]
MGWIQRFLREKAVRPERRREGRYRVFSNVEAAGVPNPWTRQLLQLADGRPASEIAEAVSREHSAAGPLSSELGVNSHLMRRSVYESLHNMASLGLVRLEPMESTAQPVHCR